jgi:PAS domain S-box-containing protein
VRSGEGRWYDVSITPVCDVNNRTEQLLVVARDVTASHSSETKFNVLFDNSANAHIIFDRDRVLACNQSAVEMLGFSAKAEILGMDAAALSPERQPDGSLSETRREEIWDIVRRDGHVRYEWQARKVNGEELPVQIAITPVWADGREVMLAVWMDLTERRQVEALLQESETRFQAFMEHSPTLCFIKDDEGRMFFVNRVMAKAFGVSAEEMVGKTDFDWLPAATAEAIAIYASKPATAKIKNPAIQQFGEKPAGWFRASGEGAGLHICMCGCVRGVGRGWVQGEAQRGEGGDGWAQQERRWCAHGATQARYLGRNP